MEWKYTCTDLIDIFFLLLIYSLLPNYDINQTLCLFQTKLLIQFEWQGKHWISKEMLYLPIHIISRIRDFRIQFVNRFLNIMNDEECHPCFYFSKFFLSKVSNLNYDVQLFLLDGDFQYRNISTFHQELIKTWKCFESS
jgi:hypothetical protein